MPDDQNPALQAKPAGALPDAAVLRPARLPGCVEDMPRNDALCRDGAYTGIVTAVRKAVERNAVFGS